ncbi:MAG: SURF1 family protein [Salinibacterium sp.]|nr:SURF1 family protein [Salinibacterium sp.]
MKGWGFALSRRWIGYLALVVAFAVACVGLSMWQLARRDEALDEITRVEQNWEAPPRPLADVLPELDSFEADQKWTRVTLDGHYLVDDELLARGRPLDGSAGFEQLVPLQLDDGRVFVVDRGWLAAGNEQDRPDTDPAPPEGRVSVVVRLKAGEPTVVGRSAPSGQVATINLPTIATLIGKPLYTGAYGVLDSEDPAAARPTAVSKPIADEGPHLSYAFQWILFGLMAFIGLGWAIRQEFRIRNADDPDERARAELRRLKAAAKPKTDAEIEDELLDAR